MNTNAINKWAVAVDRDYTSEAIQRIAFSFGYNWVNSGQQIMDFECKFLVFDPKEKVITHADNADFVKTAVNKIVYTINAVMDMFKNPPQEKLPFRHEVVVSKNGDVNFTIPLTLLSKTFDELVGSRNKFIGKEEPAKSDELPAVTFVYKAEAGANKRVRNILVQSVSDTYINGYDVSDSYQFKKFVRNKIVGDILFEGIRKMVSA
jgi:hypothetical protein